MKPITVINIDNMTNRFYNEPDFITWVQGIFDENEEVTKPEDTLVKPETVQECKSYILNYCGNLEFA